MARVTVEDCIDKVENRFELVAVAAQRAKDLASGDTLLVDNEKHEKFTVLSLREIGADKVDVVNLRENLVNSFIRPFGNENAQFEFDSEDAQIAADMENLVIPGTDAGPTTFAPPTAEELQAAEALAHSEIAAAGLHEVDGDEPLGEDEEQ